MNLLTEVKLSEILAIYTYLGTCSFLFILKFVIGCLLIISLTIALNFVLNILKWNIYIDKIFKYIIQGYVPHKTVSLKPV